MAMTKRQTVLIIFVIIFALNLIDQFVDSVQTGHWGPVIGQMLILAILGYLMYRSRDSFSRSREEYKRRFEASQHDVSVKDAALFSLSWSREIYKSIPQDRKQLVKQAFVLIGIGMIVVWLQVGFDSLLTVIIIAALILAGVNLLVWVFASERSEKDRLRIELDAARHMQLSLMPTEDPHVEGYDVAGLCIPAQNVGGDHFDYVWLGNDNRRFGVAVVDVAGKGVDAAMTAIFTSGAFISEVQHESDISEIMCKLNRAVRSRNNRTRFVSFFLLELDTASGEIRYVNAGQTKPILLSNGVGKPLESEGDHYPLGLVESVSYKPGRVTLKPGDSLVLYTDGLTEAMNPQREVYGEERMTRTALQLLQNGATSRRVVDSLKNEVVAFSQPAEQHDDLTIVAIRAT